MVCLWSAEIATYLRAHKNGRERDSETRNEASEARSKIERERCCEFAAVDREVTARDVSSR
jgi:hypothetical protein